MIGDRVAWPVTDLRADPIAELQEVGRMWRDHVAQALSCGAAGDE